MDYLKKNYKKIIGIIAILLILVFAYWYGGNAPGARGFKIDKNDDQIGQVAENEGNTETKDESTSTETVDLDKEQKTEKSSEEKTTEAEKTEDKTEKATDASEEKKTEDKSEEKTEKATEKATEKKTEKPTEKATEKKTEKSTEKSTEPKTDNVEEKNPDKKPGGNSDKITESKTEKPTEKATEKPTEKTTEKEPEQTYECTISISCGTILNHMDMLTPGKESIIPSNGVILGTRTVEFKEGDTVFDVLQRVCRENGVSLEYSYTPMYGSYYIEGIYNLYEFDCGNLSGWMYCVNGWFPNYGCSDYELSDGDIIRWVYTCDLGSDVGGSVE